MSNSLFLSLDVRPTDHLWIRNLPAGSEVMATLSKTQVQDDDIYILLESRRKTKVKSGEDIQLKLFMAK